MKVLISDQLDQQVRAGGRSFYQSLKEAIRILEPLRPDAFASHSMIHKLVDAGEDIYVLRHHDLRFFLTIQGDDALLIGVSKPQINLSRGQRLKFAANGNPVSGTIVESKKTPGFWATVTVETETPIKKGAQLSIPDLPETGGCGLADPVNRNGRIWVELNIGYSWIDLSTMEK
jgi:hypothetical protein